MGKKKQTGGKPSGRKPNRSPSYTLYVRLPVELGAAFEAYVASLRPKPSATATVEVAIEDFLTQKGFWPREGADAEGAGDA